MNYEDAPNPDPRNRIQRLVNGIRMIRDTMIAGFEENNKGLEHGSCEGHIVATTKIPDHIPDDWQ